MSDRQTKPEPPPPEPGDFYFNADGLMVFTRGYHLKRGYCCKSGCLHCPWDYRLRSARRARGAGGDDPPGRSDSPTGG